MFKDHETPISLFSFQDIITCLTGIMLFFLLILSIKLMEITKMLEQQSPYRAEIVEWRERNELLKRQLRELAENIRTYRQRLAGAKREDRATLSIAKFRLEKKAKELRQNALKLQAEKNSKATKRTRAEVRKKQLERESEELQRIEDKLRQIRQQNRSYQENIGRLREDIRKRKHSVNVSVIGNTDKTPVVLECSRDRIRIVERSPKRVIVIQRKGAFLTEMVHEACKALKRYPPQKHYFALLVKPSAADYLSYFGEVMEKICPQAEFGCEPILESEECD